MRRKRKHDDRDTALAAQVHQALAADGQLIPQTEADVAAAEQRLAAEPVELPAALQDPMAVRQRAAPTGETNVIAFPTKTDVDAALRRAAREGGHLTPDVEQRMQEDRRRAQQEQDDPNHGPDAG